MGGSFTDLTKFVASDAKRGPYDGLAREIGSEVYADVNGWHLYLRDMKACESLKMDMALAAQIGPKVDRSGYDERDVEDVVRKVGVRLWGGQTGAADRPPLLLLHGGPPEDRRALD